MKDSSTDNRGLGLPSAGQIRQAIEIYLRHAYPAGPPEKALRFLPPERFCPAEWLRSDFVEPDEKDAPPEQVRSFALRIGNSRYPHMKLRLTRPPSERVYLFMVDSHDAFLTAAPGSADERPLEELKRHNAAVAAAITADLDAAGLPTERNYLREKIRQARAARSSSGSSHTHRGRE